MRNKRNLIRFSLVAISLVVTAGAAWAGLTSTSFRLFSNNLAGSASGGASISSTNFRLQGTFNSMSARLSSTSYRLCAGYACQAPTFMVYGPAIQNSYGP
jgi:hypothetical protein